MGNGARLTCLGWCVKQETARLGSRRERWLCNEISLAATPSREACRESGRPHGHTIYRSRMVNAEINVPHSAGASGISFSDGL